MLVRLFVALALACRLLSLPVPALAEGTTAGQFDFYVLSLSWSPSYCEAAGDKRKDSQCTRPFGFVVHGLWPQFEKGYPSDCADTNGRLPQSLIKAQLDIFPAPGLIVHEWTKHGSCSGLDPAAYFEAAHKAFAGITIPAALGHIDKPQFAVPGEIAKDFIASNPGLDASAMAVVCNRQRLEEVRICINKDLKTFHACPQVASGSCRQEKTYMPAMRATN
jgi:ribonuclease T2